MVSEEEEDKPLSHFLSIVPFSQTGSLDLFATGQGSGLRCEVQKVQDIMLAEVQGRCRSGAGRCRAVQERCRGAAPSAPQQA